MEIEKTLARYVTEGKYEDLPVQTIEHLKNVLLTIFADIIAGFDAEGCEEVLDQVVEWGGKKEATALIYGIKLPAYNAAFVNAVMARALDFDDSMEPGIHIGASTVPTALAVAEQIGGCTGKEFLASLIFGTELSVKLNLNEHQYDGFDPTGVCTIYATTAIAARLLHLDSDQMLNALALAFNKSGGSLQSNIDGSLAVRLIQGFVAQNGVMCAQLAKRGLTGPQNFLEGVWGYFHLYGKDQSKPQAVLEKAGREFKLTEALFKKYPSCGGTLSSTDAIIELINQYNLSPENVTRIDIEVTPFIYNLVGKKFETGSNPRVNAQFNIRYCVANALLRKNSRLNHFDEEAIKDKRIKDITQNIYVSSNPELEKRGHTALNMQVTTKGGVIYRKNIDIGRGFPGNSLTKEEHLQRFRDCISYRPGNLPAGNINQIISLIDKIETLPDVRILIPLLIKDK